MSSPGWDGMGWERDDFYVALKKESPHRTTKEEAKVVVVPRMNSAGLSFGVVSLDKHGVKDENEDALEFALEEKPFRERVRSLRRAGTEKRRRKKECDDDDDDDEMMIFFLRARLIVVFFFK